jgi:hypothetical protein
VEISSLPNHLLSSAMMGATLEQAQLDEFVVNLVTKPGVQRGEALVTLSTMDAALRCTQHFHGRRWDASGVMVSARMLAPKAHPAPRGAASRSSTTSKPKSRKAAAKEAFRLSVGAPVFRPGVLQPLPENLPTPSKLTMTVDSFGDVSTEDGESVASSDYWR